MPKSAALIKREDLSEIEVEEITRLLKRELENFSDEVKDKVTALLEFFRWDWSEEILIFCSDFQTVKNSFSNDADRELINKSRNALNFREFHIKNRKSLAWYIKSNRWKQNFLELVTRQTLAMHSIDHYSFCAIINNIKHQKNLKLPEVLVFANKANKLKIIDIDIIAKIALNDESCWNASHVILTLAKKHWIEPDDSIKRKIEKLEQRT